MAAGENQALTIREATAADIPQLVALHRASLEAMQAEASGSGVVVTGSLPDAAEIAAMYQEALGADENVVLVAQINGALAGVAQGVVEESGDELLTAPYLTVYHVAVDPRLQGRGVGLALMQRLERVAAERGLTTVELRVWATNQAARGLYEYLGYTTLEHRMAKHLE